MDEKPAMEMVSTGIPGLDDILRWGLTGGKMYLISGTPGSGKTTSALQFLEEGIRRGEPCLYVAVATTPDEILEIAGGLGISLNPKFFNFHLVAISPEILEGPENRIFHSSERELSGTLQDILAEVKRVKPRRLVIDSLSDLRLVVEDMVSYRRLILALRQQFGAGECTVFMTNHGLIDEMDQHLETIAYGVIYLDQVVHTYGKVTRRLLVKKCRGKDYRSGWHDFTIGHGGVRVFPTLVPAEHKQMKRRELVSSGNEQLDALLCGGLNRGSSTAIIGASGTGKTTLANLYAVAAAGRGERAVIYLFDETDESFMERADGMGLAVGNLIARGLISVLQVGVAEFAIGEFTAMIRHEVENKNATTIIIDTLSGYASAMLDEKHLNIQLHELLTYLTQKGVTSFLTVEQHGIFGDIGLSVRDISYLTDTSLLLRFFEHRGSVRRAISVIKKRRGKHETTIRNFSITDHGVVIGDPLIEMQGVLTGVPILVQ